MADELLNQLIAAAGTGRIALNQSRDRQMLHGLAVGQAIGGHHVRIAPELEDLLLTLSRVATLSVMSLYRFEPRHPGSPHGTVGTDGGVTVRAVDIAALGGTKVTLHDRAGVIRVVSALIRNFPEGTFDLGFPRPLGGRHCSPSEDVFFPVPDLATAERCVRGEAVMPLSRMLEPARTAVRAAMAASRGRFGLLYPDGLDHLHVKALPHQPRHRRIR